MHQRDIRGTALYQEIAAFYVADKIDVRIFLQQGVCRLGEDVSLTFFFADIQESHPRLVDAEDMLRI